MAHRKHTTPYRPTCSTLFEPGFSTFSNKTEGSGSGPARRERPAGARTRSERGVASKAAARREKAKPKTAEDLDKELDAYSKTAEDVDMAA